MSFRKQLGSDLRIHVGAVILCFGVIFIGAAPSTAQRAKKATPARPGTQPALAEGRQFFEGRCAGCHGLDGRGAERAPDIVRSPTAQQRSPAKLEQIIREGVPEAGMPAFSTLDPVTMNALVAYIQFLQGKGSAAAKVSGNAPQGEAIFFGEGRCADCHLISGKGGFVASDLSAYGRGRSADEIREAIVKPDEKNRRAGVLLVTTRDGSKLSGVLRNEDNFSLQLQSLDGAFHLLMKSEIQNVVRQPGSLMPTNYGSLLSKQELDDLIAFLVRSAERDKSPANKKSHEEEENE